MQKSKTTIATFVIILFASSLSYLQAQELDPYQFFPANVGDRWEYTVAGPDGRDTVYIETVLKDSIDESNGNRFIFYNNTYEPRWAIDKNYYVFDGDWYQYKLDAQVGESWVVNVGTNRTAKVLDISQAYIFGTLTTVKTIGFYREGVITKLSGKVIANATGIQYWQKLAYGFGIISQENGVDKPILLRGCRINGITYGTVDVEDEPKIIPSEYILYQNYLNPFNPSTTISFSIPNYSQVVVKVFDILGREIQEIVNDYFYPGKHSVEFNASNLASGIYFYTLKAGSFTQTNKMILIK